MNTNTDKQVDKNELNVHKVASSNRGGFFALSCSCWRRKSSYSERKQNHNKNSTHNRHGGGKKESSNGVYLLASYKKQRTVQTIPRSIYRAGFTTTLGQAKLISSFSGLPASNFEQAINFSREWSHDQF